MFAMVAVFSSCLHCCFCGSLRHCSLLGILQALQGFCKCRRISCCLCASITIPRIWFFKKILNVKGQKTTTAQAVSKDVLEVLHGPFRPPNIEDKGTLHWESVLIGRRLILLTCQSFITCPMSRMVSMAAACLLITIHHVTKNPYREPIANKAETLSLTTLTLIAVINLTKATLLAVGITIDGPYRSYLKTLEWFEVISFAFVPVLVSVLVVIAILSQLARLVAFLIKQSFQLGSPEWLMEQRRPLLDIAA